MGGNRGGTITSSRVRVRVFLFDFFVVPSSPDEDFLFLFPEAAAAAVEASLVSPPAAVDGVDEEVSVLIRRDFVTIVFILFFFCGLVVFFSRPARK